MINDTHLHKPLKDYTRKLASLWYTVRMKVLNQMRSKETLSISTDEDRNLIKKGWDYRDPMYEVGFLSRAREARVGWKEAHKEAKRKDVKCT